MKEDYLWDQTGSDPEIEKLENALAVFRYKETAPPELPAKIVDFPVQRRGKAFRIALAAAACLAFGVVSLGVWFQILRTNMEIKGDVAAADTRSPEATSPVKTTGSEPLPDHRPKDAEPEKAKTAEPPAGQKLVRIRQAAPVKASQKTTRAQFSRQTKSNVFLTEEEKYAYDQLMLALSITGSKLKIVKDKVEGLDEKIAAVENAR